MMFHSRVVEGRVLPGGRKEATLAWPPIEELTIGTNVVVMSVAEFKELEAKARGTSTDV